ncbi:MAG: hypothetical protein LBG97_01005 [Coriobacteriales bacterium]|jgi:hypothetical protein|nr:hypothetical protein [Coriobacteriales bacterium]
MLRNTTPPTNEPTAIQPVLAVTLQTSDEFGSLQRLIDSLFREKKRVSRLDVILAAESNDLCSDLIEIVSLLPPNAYNRQRLCDQLNSAICGHGWGLVYGTVE